MAAPSRIHLTSPAVDYIDNRLQMYHPAFIGPPTQYDTRQKPYVASSGSEVMSIQREWHTTTEPEALADHSSSHDKECHIPPPLHSFSDILQRFKAEYPDEPQGRCEKRCSIRSKASWEEVLDVLQSTSEAYLSKTGVKGKVRRAGRFIADKAAPVQRLTSLVPEIDPYTRPIVGTLTILLEAFKRTKTVREAVKEGLQDLATKFEDIDTFCRIYSGHEKIAKATMTLHVSILKAVEDVVGFYTKHIIVKGFSAVLGGEKYEESLLSSLTKVNDNGKQLHDEASKIHIEESHETREDVKTGLKRQDSIREAQDQLLVMFNEHIRRKDIEVEHERLHHRQQMKELTGENARLRLRLEDKDEGTTHSRIGYIEPLISGWELLNFLNMCDLEDVDLEYIMQLQGPLTSGRQNRNDQIMKSTQFSEWLVKPSSQELLIHGNSDPKPVSPISFFCGMLVQSLRSVNRFHTLSFFCGRHPEEDYGGGRTMIMSLLAQLLQQQHFELGFIQDEDIYHMGGGDVAAFCFVFGQLIRQIDIRNTVFCVIDGINFYERGEAMLQEMAYVLRFLLDLTRDSTVFKILMTSSSTTEDVRQAIEDSNYLSLPGQPGDSRPFSKLQFERQCNEAAEFMYSDFLV